MARIKKRFSTNQVVVFRFSDRKMVGRVVMVRPIGKIFNYDVLAEDGKIYEELAVDSNMNHSIDTYLTRLFYRKYNISESEIPVTAVNVPEIDPSQYLQESSIISDDCRPDMSKFADQSFNELED